MTATKRTTMTPAERIAQCEAALAASLPRWRQLAPVQAMAPSAVAPALFDPRRLIERQSLAVEIDQCNIDLECAKTDQAEANLAELGDAPHLDADLAEATTRFEEAQRIAAAAEATMLAATRKRDRHRLHRKQGTAAMQHAAAQTERWRRELERDRAALVDAEYTAKVALQLRAQAAAH